MHTRKQVIVNMTILCWQQVRQAEICCCSFSFVCVHVCVCMCVCVCVCVSVCHKSFSFFRLWMELPKTQRCFTTCNDISFPPICRRSDDVGTVFSHVHVKKPNEQPSSANMAEKSTEGEITFINPHSNRKGASGVFSFT